MGWQKARWFPVPIFRALKSEYSFAPWCSGLLPQSTGFQSHQNSHFTSCQTTAQAGNGNLEHSVYDLRCVLSPGSWKVTNPWICKRWWDKTLYWLGKSGNEREVIVVFFFFFFLFKALQCNYKTWLGFASCSSPQQLGGQCQGAAAAAALWLGGRMGTVFIRCFQAERCAYTECVSPLNTEEPGLQSSSRRKIPVLASCRPEPRALTESCVQHKQIPLWFSSSCSVILLHLAYRTE